MTYANKLEDAIRSFIRGGMTLQTVFEKKTKFLSGDECMSLMNTYAIPPREVYLLAISHQFDIDQEEFIRLLEEQRDEMKKSKQCKSVD
jgi:alanyl-tRNA synthetase